MYKSRQPDAFFWDFDGVLIDSMPVRDTGFEQVLKDYPRKEIESLIRFHHENGGLSRYVKFRYFFETIRGEQISEEKVRELAADFSMIMREALTDTDLLIKDSLAFVKRIYKQVPLHIVSGSDGSELRFLCNELGIASYFLTIDGSPTPKTELVKHLLSSYPYRPDATMLIGDSYNDFEAASANGILFFGYNNTSLKGIGDGYIDLFDSFELTL